MRDNRSKPAASRLVPAVAVLAIGAVAAMAAAGAGVETLLMWNVAFTLAAASALVGMLVARAAAAVEDRRRWTWWTAGAAAWVVGQVGWDLHALRGSEAAGVVADIGYCTFALLIIVGTLRKRAGEMRVVTILETVSLIAAVMALIAGLLWMDVADSTLPVARRLVVLAYPVVHASAVVVTLQAAVGGSLRPIRGLGARVVLAGMATEAVAFILWSPQLLDETYISGATAVDYLWVAGLLAMAAGGVLAARSSASPQRSDREARGGGVLPGLTFGLLVAALVWAQATAAAAEAVAALTVGLLSCGVMLVLRSSLLERRLSILLTRERRARRELSSSESRLARLNDRLQREVRCDPLTGLHNRRALAEDLPALEAHAIRHGESFAIALCDIDHFKAFNDSLGHLAGDDLLREVAARIRGVLRIGDAAYRYGGEEFLLLLRSSDERDAQATAERVRIMLEEARIPHPGLPSGVVTVSVGVAAGAAEAALLVAQADAALYEAKRAGRNRVAIAGSERQATAPRCHGGRVDDPVIRHVEGMLSVARAGARERGAAPVVDALARFIQSELRFQTVVVNLRDDVTGDYRVVLVAGAAEARAALEGTSSPPSSWEPLLAAHERNGACWLPAGSVDWDDDENASWTPAPNPSLDPDAWKADDMLLLPMRDPVEGLLGIVSVDEPLTGRRPDDAQIALLMAVVDHASVLLAQAMRAPGGRESAAFEPAAYAA